jgi:hypothetical protein
LKKKKHTKADVPQEGPEVPRPASPSVEDQVERGYYYDDSHGYQTFDPDSVEESEEDSLSGDD